MTLGNERSSAVDEGRELRRIGKGGVFPNGPRDPLLANSATGAVVGRVVVATVDLE